MEGRVERAWRGVRAVVREVRREDITFMAASIAYHAFVSMLPILLFLTLITSVIGQREFVATVSELTRPLLPASSREVVITSLRNTTDSVGISIAGIVVLLWGTFKIFRAMDAAFAEIYDTEPDVSTLNQVRDAVVVMLALVVATVGMIAVGPFVRIPDAIPYTWVVNGLVTVGGLAIAFFPMYYVFPNVRVSVGEVIPGVLVAALGWVSLKGLFALYATFSNKPDLYGLVGTLLLSATWLYVGCLVLLGGAAVNATLTGRGTPNPREYDVRQFGKQVTDAESFEYRLDDLIEDARDAEVPREEVGRILRGRAEEFDGERRGPATSGSEDATRRE